MKSLGVKYLMKTGEGKKKKNNNNNNVIIEWYKVDIFIKRYIYERTYCDEKKKKQQQQQQQQQSSSFHRTQ